ncbi:chromosomal replication initiator protein DnaA [Acinetobacter bohemicus]|uniref:Chromosomal replication initiator protein DnaA n=2 Tax=Acinetobacter TaxID=469 RepID=A0A9D2UQ43_ACILW|nr:MULTISPECIES: chromosomal replication initiator protein DnaA [unclassified Acinetobacter]MDM1782213.1 chromosomal replication initiator protein DnaA [Acinetobacter indicus]HJF26681.1 chromosomal replication initiator protein DnaA [Acinetobacter lwoffii]MCO8045823.1 chromosomal replication initiator protein DnaA [Acinetobacter sp. S4397-1]QKQ68764.1 chromosomal replication initiator protein DnaA [Acinetobacter sp. 10FS3-1]TSH71299.1 chromosomal replication initiator protein DnaA [Acinetobact
MLWTDCLNRLRQELSGNVFTMWIRPLVAEELDDTLRLYAPNPYWTRYIQEHHLELISILAEQLSEGRVRKVEILVDSRPGVILSASEQPATTTAALASMPAPVAKPKREKEDTAKNNRKRQLNPLFTFSLFVEGRSNQMAAETCRKVLTQLGASQHNPLFLYGPTGLGKTHLMQAVGNALLQAKPNARVMYMTAESFVRDFVSSLQQGKVEEFKKNCRSLDLLLVDDIHLLAGKEASLVEFFYTFNALLDESKQIILTSDRYPKELTELDPRLVSRFSWGLSVGVEPPDIETRIEILLKKAENTGVDLPRNCALFIAQQVVANVRELEGALNKVVAISRFKGTPIDLDVVRESLKDVLAIRARTISTENIQRVVSEYFRIPLKELVGPKRTRIYARPRQLAMGLARELTGDSFPEIGMAFGGRDHSTVMHACEKVQSLREQDPIFNEDYKNLQRLLQS